MLNIEIIDNLEPLNAVVDENIEIIHATIYDGGARGADGAAADAAFPRVAGETLSALKVVWEDSLGNVYPLDYRDGLHIDLIVGLTVTAALVGNEVMVQRLGNIDGNGLNLVEGRVWLGVGGDLTQTAPEDGYDVLIGYATAEQRLYLKTQDNIKLED